MSHTHKHTHTRTHAHTHTQTHTHTYTLGIKHVTHIIRSADHHFCRSHEVWCCKQQQWLCTHTHTHTHTHIYTHHITHAHTHAFAHAGRFADHHSCSTQKVWHCTQQQRHLRQRAGPVQEAVLLRCVCVYVCVCVCVRSCEHACACANVRYLLCRDAVVQLCCCDL